MVFESHLLRCLLSTASARWLLQWIMRENQLMGKGRKTLTKTHPVLTPCSSRGAGDPWEDGTVPKTPPGLEKGGALPGALHLHQHLRGSRLGPCHLLPTSPSIPVSPGQQQLTTPNMGLSKPLSPAGSGDATSSALSQGRGKRRVGNLGRDPGITHLHPSRRSSSPSRNTASSRGGWENMGAKFQAV